MAIDYRYYYHIVDSLVVSRPISMTTMVVRLNLVILLLSIVAGGPLTTASGRNWGDWKAMASSINNSDQMRKLIEQRLESDDDDGLSLWTPDTRADV